jgi:hypothetical protein
MARHFVADHLCLADRKINGHFTRKVRKYGQQNMADHLWLIKLWLTISGLA